MSARLSPPGFARPAARQRGVALITAVLIVALATILATRIGFDSALEQRRSAAAMTLDLAFQVGLGAEAWAASFLKEDFDNDATPKRDHFAEKWATPIPPIPIDGGKIEGRLIDLQGRFNVNNLVTPQRTRNNEGVRQFTQLLEMLDLEEKWADVLVDWLDADTEPAPMNGAEDNIYLSQSPPYRSANGPITSISELMALPEFGRERYEKLRPYITALPIGEPMNVCTAPGVVLDALNDGTVEYGVDPEALARSREQACFPTKQDLATTFNPQVYQQAEAGLGERSNYFALSALVTIGTTEYSLYSLLYRDPANGLVRPVMRSFVADQQ